jgi:hypothetical protein
VYGGTVREDGKMQEEPSGEEDTAVTPDADDRAGAG